MVKWYKTGKNELTVFGDPDEKVLDLVYVEDVVDAIMLTTFETNKEVFNVSTEIGVTLSELVKCISNVTGTRIQLNTLPDERTDIEKKRVGDTSKLRKLVKKFSDKIKDVGDNKRSKAYLIPIVELFKLW